jgi:phenylacetate-CoA ligase
MNRNIERLYFASPVFLQNIVSSTYGYKLYRERYVGNHDRYLEELLTSQWYSEEEIERSVNDKLCKMIAHAMRNVEFYRKAAEKENIRPEDIKGVTDLEKLPILNKEQIRQNPEAFLAEDIRKRDLISINTSGTTGKTLKIYVDKDSRRYAYAFFSRLKVWAGIYGKSRNVTFAGRTIVHPEATKPPFWRKNLVMNNTLFSSYHLSPANLPYYVRKLIDLQPQFIDSYPSSIYSLAMFMKQNNLSGISPKAIITSSETLFDHQRELIEEVFKCKIYDQYGCAEQVVFVSQCENGSYHVHPEFGIVEFLRDDGSRASPGEPARLICTGLTNRAMPLIRFDIGDTGILSDKKCSCGRHFPVIEKIIGRTDDVIVTRDGRRVGRLDPVFKGLQSVREAQIIQEDYAEIVLRIVPGKEYREQDGDTISNELKKRLGLGMKITVELVEQIPRSAAGKFRAVISKVRS